MITMPLTRKTTSLAERRRFEPARHWLSLAAVFGNNILSVLPQSGYGLWYDHLVAKYDTSRANIGISYFIFNGVLVLIIFANPFVKKFGVKNTTLFGACLSTVGFISCAFAPSVWVFNILFGVIAGVGRVIVFTLAMVQVQHLFNHNRGLATGLACLGFSVADILSPIIFAKLLMAYGIRGTLLIHGAIQAHSVMFALLYVDTRKREIADQEGQVTELAEEKERVDNCSVKIKNGQTNHREKTKSRIKELFDFSVMKNCTCMIIFGLRTMWLTTKFTANAHLASACVHYGLTEQQAAYVISVFGISGLVIMLSSTLILNMKCVRCEVYLSVGMFMLMISTACAMAGTRLSPFVFFSSSFFLGVGEAMGYPSFMLVIVQLVGSEKFQSIMLFIEGVAPMLAQVPAAPFCGWLVDVTGDYLPVFLVSSVAAVVCFMLAVIVAVTISRKTPAVTESVTVENITVEPPGEILEKVDNMVINTSVIT